MPDASESEVPEAGGGSGYAAALQSLRSTAKWLLAAFATAGTLLAAGLQLTRIGELAPDSWRLWVALSAAGLTLTSFVYMAFNASVVLAEDWVTLSGFSDDELDSVLNEPQESQRNRALQYAMQKVRDNKEELFRHVAEDVPSLNRRIRETNSEMRNLPADSQEREKVEKAMEDLRASARQIAQCANYYNALYSFKEMRKRLARAAAVAAIGLAIFAYSANPPKSDKPLDVRIEKQRSGRGEAV